MGVQDRVHRIPFWSTIAGNWHKPYRGYANLSSEIDGYYQTCEAQARPVPFVTAVTFMKVPEGKSPAMAYKSAPGELELVRQFVNTLEIDGESRDEKLGSPDSLAAWLKKRGLLSGSEPLAAEDLDRALELREALRGMLRANNGDRVGREPFEAFDRLSGGAKLSVRLEGDGSAHLEPTGSGLDAAIGRLAAIVYESEVAGTWPRLKACSADDCQWAFYDASRNRSGTWCDMTSCGNRAKVRAFRQRSSSGRA